MCDHIRGFKPWASSIITPVYLAIDSNEQVFTGYMLQAALYKKSVFSRHL